MLHRQSRQSNQRVQYKWDGKWAIGVSSKINYIFLFFSLQKPFLQLRLRDDRLHRNKRSSNGPTCYEDAPQDHCCRYHLEVDFSSFDWDWIIAPNFFVANFCSGSCPRMFNAEYPHTQIMSMLGNDKYPGPCCSASDMSSLTLLYFDDNYNIKYSELPNMVVQRCSCSWFKEKACFI